MKKLLSIILLLCNLSLYSQNRIINKEDIVGRWVEDISLKSDSNHIEAHSYTYIFRENMIFHLGEIYNGIILFNIAGKYTLDNNIISVVYYDLINGNAKTRKAHHISYEIVSLKNERMILLTRDYNYDYKISLKRQLK
ncbi:MAG: hypothetical protein LBR46_00160 [Prevotella sp.]|jgi:hypothetical protein|nr:hypothetical protein [Prevotella sp.]